MPKESPVPFHGGVRYGGAEKIQNIEICATRIPGWWESGILGFMGSRAHMSERSACTVHALTHSLQNNTPMNIPSPMTSYVHLTTTTTTTTTTTIFRIKEGELLGLLFRIDPRGCAAAGGREGSGEVMRGRLIPRPNEPPEQPPPPPPPALLGWVYSESLFPFPHPEYHWYFYTSTSNSTITMATISALPLHFTSQPQHISNPCYEISTYSHHSRPFLLSSPRRRYLETRFSGVYSFANPTVTGIAIPTSR